MENHSLKTAAGPVAQTKAPQKPTVRPQKPGVAPAKARSVKKGRPGPKTAPKRDKSARTGKMAARRPTRVAKQPRSWTCSNGQRSHFQRTQEGHRLAATLGARIPVRDRRKEGTWAAVTSAKHNDGNACRVIRGDLRIGGKTVVQAGRRRGRQIICSRRLQTGPGGGREAAARAARRVVRRL
jgi:hypothetical protein